MQDQSDKVRVYVDDVTRQIINGVPKLLGALLIILIGYLIAKGVENLVRQALLKVRLNDRLHTGSSGNIIQRAVPNPSGAAASVAFWLLFLFALSLAASALGIPALVNIVNGIYAYIPNIIAAILIFLVAGAISATATALVSNAMGDTPTGKILASTVPVLVMGIAAFMILNQLKIAPEIVTITYAGLVATATLAFGLGGKDAASKMFLSVYDTAQRNQAMIAGDLKKGARTTKAKAKKVKDQL